MSYSSQPLPLSPPPSPPPFVCGSAPARSYNISVFVEVMKVTMNLLQRFSLGVFPTILGVSPGDHVIQQVRAELLGTRRTCEQLLLGGEGGDKG